MFDSSMTIEGFDDEIFSAIGEEERRQEEHIELIASENYASPRVLQAQGSVLTNKYAEGYPHKIKPFTNSACAFCSGVLGSR